MKVWITSSSRVKDDKYLEVGTNVAKIFSNFDYELLCGGISSSMMKNVYDVFSQEKKNITCVTLKCYNEQFDDITPIYVENTFDRAKTLYNLADVIVFLPGGTGSISEIFSTLEEYRTISSDKKLILYNEFGFYDTIIMLINDLVSKGFNDISILEKIEIVNSKEELEKRVSEVYE